MDETRQMHDTCMYDVVDKWDGQAVVDDSELGLAIDERYIPANSPLKIDGMYINY